MVLESIIRPSKMEKTPTEMFLVGFFYSTVGLFLALLIFGGYAGLAASLAGIFFTTMPLVVIMTKTIRLEEEKDLMVHKETFLIKEHGKALSMFLFLFIGMLISYSFWFTILPGDQEYLFSIDAIGMEENLNQGIISDELRDMFETKEFPLSKNATIKKEEGGKWEITDRGDVYIISKEDGKLNIYHHVMNLFKFQIDIIESIQKSSTAVGKATQEINELEKILSNNFMVLIFCILFSFLYGAGAIFILTLNASVIGVAVGSTLRRYIAMYAFQNHLEFIYNYFNWSVSITLCYMLHGVFEISAYFVGALAGGIISVAVVNHDFRTKKFWRIVIDSLDLIILSILLLFLAGIIEVFITPLLC